MHLQVDILGNNEMPIEVYFSLIYNSHMLLPLLTIRYTFDSCWRAAWKCLLLPSTAFLFWNHLMLSCFCPSSVWWIQWWVTKPKNFNHDFSSDMLSGFCIHLVVTPIIILFVKVNALMLLDDPAQYIWAITRKLSFPFIESVQEASSLAAENGKEICQIWADKQNGCTNLGLNYLLQWMAC